MTVYIFHHPQIVKYIMYRVCTHSQVHTDHFYSTTKYSIWEGVKKPMTANRSFPIMLKQKNFLGEAKCLVREKWVYRLLLKREKPTNSFNQESIFCRGREEKSEKKRGKWQGTNGKRPGEVRNRKRTGGGRLVGVVHTEAADGEQRRSHCHHPEADPTAGTIQLEAGAGWWTGFLIPSTRPEGRGYHSDPDHMNQVSYKVLYFGPPNHKQARNVLVPTGVRNLG